jgi:hypothetical protein
MFWASPYAMRYGVTENLYGTDEIEAFRKARPAVGLARRNGSRGRILRSNWGMWAIWAATR